MSDYYYIPNELLRKILTYLPAKSLVRFTCVCKSWKSLITSSDFITTHLIQNTLSSNKSSDVDGNNLVLLRYCPGDAKKRQYSLHIDNESFDQYDVSEFLHRALYFRILGSCNGLICLSDEIACQTTFTVVLWNPSIRKYLTLPRPEFSCVKEGLFDHAIGFGFDSRTNDYKVVRLVYLLANGLYSSPRVELYRLSTRSWETIAATIDPSCRVFYHPSRQAFISGAVHWPAFNRDTGAGGGGVGLIMSFNMSDEVFREIRLPVIEFESLLLMSLAVYGEWLSFYDFNNGCSIWVMKEYGVLESWAKLYTLDLDGGFGKLLGLRRNGEILLVMRNGELDSFDPENQQVKHLGIYETYETPRRGSDKDNYRFHMEPYIESLTLLGDANRPGQSL